MLTIDARWVNQTGIGTYLRHLIPGILKAFPDLPICLLGNRAVLSGFGWLEHPGVQFVSVDAKMYSLAEQWKIFRSTPSATRLLFYPHYNIPVLYRGRMLVTVYDLCHVALPAAGAGILKTAYARWFFRAVRKRATAVITISRFTRDELVKRTIPSTQPVVPIHLGVDDGWFTAAALRNTAESSGPGHVPYVLYVGNVKPHKNLNGLVEAWGTLANSVPHKLVIVGKRSGLITADQKVQKAAARFGERIEFTGYVDDDSLKCWVANADVLVLPSFYEGFGLPPLEAMAAGCPVAVSDIPVLREICGDAAIYFNPHDSAQIAARLHELLLDVGLRERLRLKGLSRAREFQWDSCVSRTCDLVRELLTMPADSTRLGAR